MSDNTPDGLDMRLLPPLLREFVEAIGLEKTLRLVTRCGGARTYFPREPGPEHWVSELIGLAEARKLGRVCGSDPVVVPKAVTALRDLRDRQLMAARAASSLNKAAKQFGLTRRAAQMIVQKRRDQPDAGAQPAEPQPRLFE